jgi:hypothetical protein
MLQCNINAALRKARGDPRGSKAVRSFAVFLISRLHEGVAVVDRFLNRPLDQLERTLSQAMRKAQEPADIDRLLADEPCRALKLSSAAAFRRKGSSLVR